MNTLGAAFVSVCALLILVLPRRLGAVPLLLAAGYMTTGQLIEIGGATFTALRLVIAAGFLRVLIRGERVTGGLKRVDWFVMLWGTILVATSADHTSEAWLYRSGIVWSEVGSYFLLRIFMQDLDDVERTFRILALGLAPLSLLILMQKSTGTNPFAALGGVSEFAAIRDGNIRANGPFSHAILAGTVGAVYLGIGLALWRGSRALSLASCAAGTAIVYSSASSGPVLMVAFIVLGLLAWPLRHHMRSVRAFVVCAVLLLAAVMHDPVYYLMARVDLVGGSQGYFRARLIQSSIEHLSEWWLAGTDHTSHWMPTGIAADPRHTDIANHFLHMGVLGGLPLLAMFLLILTTSFRNVGLAMRRKAGASDGNPHIVWALGALLFGSMMNLISITLFDQSATFFWLIVAAIAAVASQPSPQGAAPRPSPPLIRWNDADPHEPIYR
jgi:hypothetical protein